MNSARLTYERGKRDLYHKHGASGCTNPMAETTNHNHTLLLSR